MSFDGHTTNVTSLGFQREGKWMYTGSEDGTVKIWDLRFAAAPSLLLWPTFLLSRATHRAS
jgi:WD40 repeat protein